MVFLPLFLSSSIANALLWAQTPQLALGPDFWPWLFLHIALCARFLQKTLTKVLFHAKPPMAPPACQVKPKLPAWHSLHSSLRTHCCHLHSLRSSQRASKLLMRRTVSAWSLCSAALPHEWPSTRTLQARPWWPCSMGNHADNHPIEFHSRDTVPWAMGALNTSYLLGAPTCMSNPPRQRAPPAVAPT